MYLVKSFKYTVYPENSEQLHSIVDVNNLQTSVKKSWINKQNVKTLKLVMTGICNEKQHNEKLTIPLTIFESLTLLFCTFARSMQDSCLSLLFLVV